LRKRRGVGKEEGPIDSVQGEGAGSRSVESEKKKYSRKNLSSTRFKRKVEKGLGEKRKGRRIKTRGKSGKISNVRPVLELSPASTLA